MVQTQLKHFTKPHVKELYPLDHGVFRMIDNRTKHRLYTTWAGMIARCHQKTKGNKYYKDRGIKVCKEWRDNPFAFYEYASKLENYKKRGYSIDRIENNGDYEPGNVRWADQRTQVTNTRVKRKHKYVGISVRNNKYYTQIQYNLINHQFGPFETERDAAKRRDIFILEHEINTEHLQIFKQK